MGTVFPRYNRLIRRPWFWLALRRPVPASNAWLPRFQTDPRMWHILCRASETPGCWQLRSLRSKGSPDVTGYTVYRTNIVRFSEEMGNASGYFGRIKCVHRLRISIFNYGGWILIFEILNLIYFEENCRVSSMEGFPRENPVGKFGSIFTSYVFNN